MDITNARSMELFRSLGVVDALRAVAVPESGNFDVAWITGLTGHELHRFHYPSVTEWRRLIAERNDGTMPAEPPMRVSQVEIEPVLQRAVLAAPRVEARWSVAFEELAQDETGVTATLRTADGALEQVRCDYLVGCDGGSSRVRACLGIESRRQWQVQQRFLTHFRSTDYEPAAALGHRLALPVGGRHAHRTERQGYLDAADALAERRAARERGRARPAARLCRTGFRA